METRFDATDPAWMMGATLLAVPGRVGAIGAVAEYVATQSDELRRTSTVRVGPLLRGYFPRGAVAQPFVQLALGPAWFEHRAGGCTTEGILFLQFGGGVDVRVAGEAFVGAGATLSLQGAGRDCGYSSSAEAAAEGDERYRSPVFGLFLTLRYGPGR